MREYLSIFDLICKHIYNFMNVLMTETILIAVFHKTLTGIDNEYAFVCGCIFFVEHDDARGNTRSIKQIRR